MEAILLWAHIQLPLLLRQSSTRSFGEKKEKKYRVMPQSYCKWCISFLGLDKKSRDGLDLQFSNTYGSNQIIYFVLILT